MKVACVGGGPAGLYFAISMKLRDPSHDVEVFERNRAGDTFGWGVVFSDQTMDGLRENDPASAEHILSEFAHWDDIDVHINGAKETSTGHGFCGIGRKRLLNILQDRADELGVRQHFEVEVEPDLTDFAAADLIVAADGINSRVRSAREEIFKPNIQTRANKFTWLGCRQRFDAFTFAFEKTAHGWIWAHAYQFDQETSTFIVECSKATWAGLGFDRMSTEETCRACEDIFAAYLGGHSLMSNARHLRGSAWLNFNRVLCDTWSTDNIVLLGDAAHTAHFSIGSGTKLAFEDAITLADVLHDTKASTDAALNTYEDVRRIETLKLQSAARNSTEWFENVERYTDFEPKQFAYSLLTRSQRVSHENLRLRDKAWLEDVEAWYAGSSALAAAGAPIPPMFTPYQLGELALPNRIVVSPMCMYSAVDGLPTAFHKVHYGARCLGGAGLIFTEMTVVEDDARITPGCAGLYTDAHQAAWSEIVEFAHSESQAKMALQLGHAGPKGATKLAWEGMDDPLESGAWPLVAASAQPWAPQNQTPRAMMRDDMDRVKNEFVVAAERGAACGFDLLELHCAHGYLLSSFLTPISNHRTDEYGGSLENRLRYPLEVFAAIRAVWPKGRPMSVRISANDWVGEAGIEPAEAVEIARAFVDAGADLINVSAGQTSPDAAPVYGRMFQTPFADQIRNELKCPTLAVGNIYEVDHVNSILAAGRADLVALARPHLADPNWTLRAAAELGVTLPETPQQYKSGFDQLRRNLERASELAVLA